jgi:hypothetical protein
LVGVVLVSGGIHPILSDGEAVAKDGAPGVAIGGSSKGDTIASLAWKMGKQKDDENAYSMVGSQGESGLGSLS